MSNPFISSNKGSANIKVNGVKPNSMGNITINISDIPSLQDALNSAGNGSANSLNTTVLPVNVNGYENPNPGDTLVAIDATDAQWTKYSHNNLIGVTLTNKTHAQIDTFIASAGNASGLATLDSTSKLNINQLPAIAITNVYTVLTAAAMNALIGIVEGDVCMVTSDPTASNNGSFIYSGTSWIPFTMYISPQLIENLTDTSITNPTVGQFLMYNSNSQWVNSSTLYDGLVDRLYLMMPNVLYQDALSSSSGDYGINYYTYNQVTNNLSNIFLSGQNLYYQYTGGGNLQRFNMDALKCCCVTKINYTATTTNSGCTLDIYGSNNSYNYPDMSTTDMSSLGLVKLNSTTFTPINTTTQTTFTINSSNLNFRYYHFVATPIQSTSTMKIYMVVIYTITGIATLNSSGIINNSQLPITGSMVGTTDTQTLTNKTLTSSTNNITANALATYGSVNGPVTVNSQIGPTVGQVLTCSSFGTATWQNPVCTGLYTNTSGDIVSVNSASPPTSGQVLTATSSMSATWQNAQIGSSTIAGCTDVSEGTLNSGDILQYNGSKWVNNQSLITLTSEVATISNNLVVESELMNTISSVAQNNTVLVSYTDNVLGNVCFANNSVASYQTPVSINYGSTNVYPTPAISGTTITAIGYSGGAIGYTRVNVKYAIAFIPSSVYGSCSWGLNGTGTATFSIYAGNASTYTDTYNEVTNLTLLYTTTLSYPSTQTINQSITTTIAYQYYTAIVVMTVGTSQRPSLNNFQVQRQAGGFNLLTYNSDYQITTDTTTGYPLIQYLDSSTINFSYIYERVAFLELQRRIYPVVRDTNTIVLGTCQLQNSSGTLNVTTSNLSSSGSVTSANNIFLPEGNNIFFANPSSPTGKYQITANSTSSLQICLYYNAVLSTLDKSGNYSVAGNITSGNNLTVPGNVSCSGNLSCNGTASVTTVTALSGIINTLSTTTVTAGSGVYIADTNSIYFTNSISNTTGKWQIKADSTSGFDVCLANTAILSALDLNGNYSVTGNVTCSNVFANDVTAVINRKIAFAKFVSSADYSSNVYLTTKAISSYFLDLTNISTSHYVRFDAVNGGYVNGDTIYFQIVGSAPSSSVNLQDVSSSNFIAYAYNSYTQNLNVVAGTTYSLTYYNPTSGNPWYNCYWQLQTLNPSAIPIPTTCSMMCVYTNPNNLAGTFLMPLYVVNGYSLVIKDVGGHASQCTITTLWSGNVYIDGATEIVINYSYGALNLVYSYCTYGGFWSTI